jgi:hypothetical protein
MTEYENTSSFFYYKVFEYVYQNDKFYLYAIINNDAERGISFTLNSKNFLESEDDKPSFTCYKDFKDAKKFETYVRATFENIRICVKLVAIPSGSKISDFGKTITSSIIIPL